MSTKKIQFIHHYNYKLTSGEVNNEPSLTVPDQAESIESIMYKAQHGLLADRVVTHFDDTDDFDYEDIRYSPDFDLSDMDEIREKSKRYQQYQSQKNKNHDSDSKLSSKESNDQEEVHDGEKQTKRSGESGSKSSTSSVEEPAGN